LTGKVCADIGASTGGFTQCMLEHGAEFVYAVDVGHGQLDESLCNDSRVKNCEGVNARYLTANFFDRPVQFISGDLSFISLKLVIKSLILIISLSIPYAIRNVVDWVFYLCLSTIIFKVQSFLL